MEEGTYRRVPPVYIQMWLWVVPWKHGLEFFLEGGDLRVLQGGLHSQWDSFRGVQDPIFLRRWSIYYVYYVVEGWGGGGFG